MSGILEQGKIISTLHKTMLKDNPTRNEIYAHATKLWKLSQLPGEFAFS